MKHLKSITILAVLALTAVWLGGCSETGDMVATGETGVDDYATLDLDKAYGGLTPTDEPTAFGDAYFDAADGEDLESASDDPLQTDPEVLELEDRAGDPESPQRPDVTVLRLTWGRLNGAIEDRDEAVDALDWSGLLNVDEGIAVARRLILFERPRDHLVRPRIDRQTVAWVSHTGPHYDGLIVEILRPRPAGGAEDAATDAGPAVKRLHLSTPQVSFDIPLDELDGLDRTVLVDDAGNALRIEGHRLGDEDLCPKGFLSGIWIAEVDEETGAAGYFKGRWVGLWGQLKGHMRGVYGVNSDGESVFYGKTINRSGRFLGLLSGTYAGGEEPGHGVFNGEWVDAAETVEGVLGGEWVQIEGRPGGFYSGRWATLCDDEAVESIR